MNNTCIRCTGRRPPPRFVASDIFTDSVCNADGTLYVTGAVSSLRCSVFFKLDACNNKWIMLADMRDRRINAKLIHLDGRIYAFGCESNPHNFDVYIVEENVWKALPSVPEEVQVNYKLTACTTYEGKILIYGVNPIEGASVHAGDIHDHKLLMFDPVSSTWSVLMTESHPAAPQRVLLVGHKGKCYRVLSGTCKCTAAGCQWHDLKIVQELQIDLENMTAVVGNKQNQEFEDADQASCDRSRWRINGDEFVASRGKLYIAGIGLHKESCSHYMGIRDIDLSTKYRNSLTTSFTFDTANWL